MGGPRGCTVRLRLGRFLMLRGTFVGLLLCATFHQGALPLPAPGKGTPTMRAPSEVFITFLLAGVCPGPWWTVLYKSCCFRCATLSLYSTAQSPELLDETNPVAVGRSFSIN
jgi:hypothetical protein